MLRILVIPDVCAMQHLDDLSVNAPRRDPQPSPDLLTLGRGLPYSVHLFLRAREIAQSGKSHILGDLFLSTPVNRDIEVLRDLR